jgi:hypothetical protein
MPRGPFLFRTLCSAALLLLPAIGRGSDHILTFGGGPVPSHNQQSLERNVLYFQSILQLLHMDKVPNDIFFADGSSKSRIVQYRDTTPAADDITSILASIYNDDSDSLTLRFRPATIPGVAGPSTAASINNWFDGTGKKLSPQDHLLIYFTGHGGQPDRRHPRDTVLFTWNDNSIAVHDFITQLDKLDPAVEVTLVMVQCHSGGFANVIYNQGDPAKGLSKHHRCGFFATIATRPAAGCTPDIDEDDYQEFSTVFFAALSGKTRAGKIIERPDYDHDGVTTLAEAFTYVLLTSDTIDIPMTTSDQFLIDQFPQQAPPQDDNRLRGRRELNVPPVNATYSSILATATPAQKAALEELSAQLKLTGDDRLAAARALAFNLDRERRTVQDDQHAAENRANGARQRIKRDVTMHWPEFDIPWHPQTTALVTAQGPAIKDAIAHDPSYKTFTDAQDKADAAAEKDLNLERKWVKLMRFINRAEVVARAAQLAKTGTPEANAAYRTLAARENQVLAHAPMVARP